MSKHFYRIVLIIALTLIIPIRTVFAMDILLAGTTRKITTTTIDNKKPTVTLKTNSSTAYANSYRITINIFDANSGLKANGTISYGWSKSRTTEPTSYKTMELKNKSGIADIEYVFSATASGISGKYYLWIKTNVQDLAGNKAPNVISTGTFNVDSVAPTIQITATSNNKTYTGGWTNKSVLFTFKYSDSGSGVNALTYSKTQEKWYNLTVNSNGTSTGTCSSETNGPYYFKICDKVGNCSTKSFNVSIDKTVPKAPIMNFVYGNWSSYKGVWAKYNLYAARTKTSYAPRVESNSGSPIAKYQISTDNKTWYDYVYNKDNDLYKMSTSGTHYRYFRAVDQAGNVSPSTKITGKIDKIAPNFDITATVDGKTYSGAWVNKSVKLTFKYSDNLNSVASLTYSKTQEKWNTLTVNSNGISTGTWSSETSGPYYFKICDNIGNCRTKSININIDKTAPNAPAMNFVYGDWSTYKGIWTKYNLYAARTKNVNSPAVAISNGSQIAKYQISTDNTNWYDYKYDKNDALYKMSTSGTHRRYFRAIDSAGNISSVTTVIGKIDKAAPRLDISAAVNGNPYNGEWTNKSVNLTFRYNDTLNDVASLSYSKNQENWNSLTVNSNGTSTGTWSRETSGPYYFKICDKVGNCQTKSIQINIDKTAPAAPSMNFVYGDWSEYKGKWTKYNLYAARTESNNSPIVAISSGSTIAKYQISTDNTNWCDYKYNKNDALYKMSTSGTHRRYFRAIDNAGNISSVTTLTGKIDKTTPNIDFIYTAKGGTKYDFTINVTGNSYSGLDSSKLVYSLSNDIDNNPKSYENGKKYTDQTISSGIITIKACNNANNCETKQVTIVKPLNITSGWHETQISKARWMSDLRGLFGYYLYVPNNPTEDMPLIVILPGQNYGDSNGSSTALKQYFEDNYDNKSIKYSNAFILIPQLDYRDTTNYGYDYIYSRLDQLLKGELELVDNMTIKDLKLDNSRISLVGFSSGATLLYKYAYGKVYLNRSSYGFSFSSLLPISLPSEYNFTSDEINYYKSVPMKGAAEGDKDYKCSTNQTCDKSKVGIYCGDLGALSSSSSNLNKAFGVLGINKNQNLVVRYDYCHGEMNQYAFSLDANGDKLNDYMEWLIGNSNQSTTPTTTTQRTTTAAAGPTSIDSNWYWPVGSDTKYEKTVNGEKRLFADGTAREAYISSPFGYREDPTGASGAEGYEHLGIDISDEGRQFNLIAAFDGEILEGTADWNDGQPNPNYIMIKYDENIRVLYGHLYINSIPDYFCNKYQGVDSSGNLFTLQCHTLKAGTKVHKGEFIGIAGNSGNSTATHLHFEVQVKNSKGEWVPVNPELYVDIDNQRPGASTTTRRVSTTNSNLTTTKRTTTTVGGSSLTSGEFIKSISYVSNNETKQMKYYVYVPEGATKNLPLIVYLGGDGNHSYFTSSTSTTISSLHNYPIVKYATDGKAFKYGKFILVVPEGLKYQQSTTLNGETTYYWGTTWVDANVPAAVMSIINNVVSDYSINTNKIAITGFSRGASGAWQYVYNNPNFFSASLPISGLASMPSDYASKFTGTDVWAATGYDHDSAYISYMRSFVININSAGGNAYFNNTGTYDHSANQSIIYTNDNVYRWLLCNTKGLNKDCSFPTNVNSANPDNDLMEITPSVNEYSQTINSYRYALANASYEGTYIHCGDRLYVTSCDDNYCTVTKINGIDVITTTKVYKDKLTSINNYSSCEKYDLYINKDTIVDDNELLCGTAISYYDSPSESCDSKSCIVKYNDKVINVDRSIIVSAKPSCESACTSSKPVNNLETSTQIKICFVYNGEFIEQDIKLKDAVTCASGYTKYETLIADSDTCNSVSNNGETCSKTYNVDCKKINKPIIEITSNANGKISFTGKDEANLGLKGYLVNEGDIPTSSDNWISFGNSDYNETIELSSGTYFIWAMDNYNQISDGEMVTISDSNQDTTLDNLNLTDPNTNKGVVINSLGDNNTLALSDKPREYVLLTNELLKESSVGSFDSYQTGYEVIVESNKIAVYATLTSNDASFVPGYEPRTVSLDYGRNVILIKIVSKQGRQRTYTIIANRVDNRDSNNLIKNISLSEGSISFDPYVSDYTIEVGSNTKEVIINADLDSVQSTFIKGYEPRTITLDSEIKSAVIKTISESGLSRTYVITFIKKGEKIDKKINNSVYLSSLSIPGTALEFAREATSYSISVPYNIEKLPVNAFPESANARVNIKGNEKFKVGPNVIEIEVKNGSKTKIYTIYVNRKEAGLEVENDTTLATLTIKDYKLKFDPNILDYIVKIKREKTLVITATPNSNRSEIYMIGNNDLTGFSTVRIKVIAENGDTRIYSIDIQKDAFDKKLELILSISTVIITLLSGVAIILKNKKAREKEYTEE